MVPARYEDGGGGGGGGGEALVYMMAIDQLLSVYTYIHVRKKEVSLYEIQVCLIVKLQPYFQRHWFSHP